MRWRSSLTIARTEETRLSNQRSRRIWRQYREVWAFNSLRSLPRGLFRTTILQKLLRRSELRRAAGLRFDLDWRASLLPLHLSGAADHRGSDCAAHQKNAHRDLDRAAATS